MMKNFINKLCFLFCFLTLTTVEIFAQPIAVPSAVKNGGGNETIFYVDDCTENVVFDMYVANLDLLSINGIGNNYPLPANVPDMYLHIIIQGGIDTIHPLTSLFTYSHTLNSINIYKTSISLPLPPGSSVKFQAAILKDYEVGDNTTTDPDLTDTYNLPTGYAFYPILDYTDIGNLFTCQLTELWTDCECDNDEFYDSCNPYPYYPGHIICEEYNENGFGTPGGGGNSSSSSFNSDNASIVQKQEPGISPNPFNTNLNIKYYAQADDLLTIQIFDINGKEMSVFEKAVTTGENEVRLNISNIPSGIYFIRLSDQYQQYTKKLFKL